MQPVINDTVYVGDTCPGTAVDTALLGISSYTCADVMFAFDLTGSMGDELSDAQANANAIMDSLMSSIADIRFGVASHMDYNGSYNHCGYSNTYGSGGDYPYRLNLPLTYDTATVRATINSLSLGNGEDGPESYARLLYEMVYDTAIHWRVECARFVVFWLDNVPHACDLNDGSRPVSYNTGADPGRDGVAGTSDDIYWYPLMRTLRTSGIKPIILYSVEDDGWGPEALSMSDWEYWMGDTLANGIVAELGDNVAHQIDSIVNSTALVIDSLWPMVRETAYRPWVVFTPPYYTGITLTPPEDTFSFGINFTVPATATPGLHTFHIDYYRDAIRVDTQLVNLWVYDCSASWDDPTAVAERRERSLYVAGTVLNVPEGYEVVFYSADGKRLLKLRRGKYDLRRYLRPGVYLGIAEGEKVVRFKVVIR